MLKPLLDLQALKSRSFAGLLLGYSFLNALQATADLKVTAVGDLMLGSTYDGVVLPPPAGVEGAVALLKPAAEILKRGDVVSGNLEGVLLDDRSVPPKPVIPGVSWYVFRSPHSFAHVFERLGFNFLSVANNHTNDFGEPGMASTRDALQATGITFSGHITSPYNQGVRLVQGKKVGLLAFGFPDAVGTRYEQRAVMNDLFDLARARELVRKLKQEVDVVIVSVHAGGEGAAFQHVKDVNELYGSEGYRGNVYQFAHTVIDAGADVVLGSSPHVARAVELYRGRLIAYSLGNFATYGRFSIHGVTALAPLLEFSIKDNGAFVGGQVHSFVQKGAGGPKADPTLTVAKTMAQLTREDFPNGQLRIDPSSGAMVVKTDSVKRVRGGSSSR